MTDKKAEIYVGIEDEWEIYQLVLPKEPLRYHGVITTNALDKQLNVTAEKFAREITRHHMTDYRLHNGFACKTNSSNVDPIERLPTDQLTAFCQSLDRHLEEIIKKDKNTMERIR